MTAPYWTDGQCSLFLGDALVVLAGMEAESFDAVVTDPPYGLEFMGKEWDAPWTAGAGLGGNTAGFGKVRMRDGASRLARASYFGSQNPTCRSCGGLRYGSDIKKSQKACRCDQPVFDDVIGPRMRAYQEWCAAWARECLRVLKPGGHMLAFGGTRTYHRLVCAIEDAGFEIRDSLHWLYGSGFPKSLDVSKAIDKAAGAEREVIGPSQFASRKPNGTWTGEVYRDEPGHQQGPSATVPATEAARQWDGWGTALKPGHEPIVLARKPLAGTVAANVLAHGTGALNIDGCRVAGDEDGSRNRPPSRLGSDATYAQDEWTRNAVVTRQDTTGVGRWPPNVLLGPEAAAELDRQSGQTEGGNRPARRGGIGYGSGAGGTSDGVAIGYDSGGASRFFPVFRYEAKAGSAERPRGEDGTAHPTVKPVDLMCWLVRLVTRPGALILDPFAGSGTTGEACVIEGRRCVLIEKHEPYADLIRRRLSKPIQPGLFDLTGEPA